MLHLGTKVSKRVRRNLRAIATLSRCGRPPRAQPCFNAQLPTPWRSSTVIADCDPADPVTAASQGKRADSYLRFLDKDGARRAAGHRAPLFTSEDADPSV